MPHRRRVGLPEPRAAQLPAGFGRDSPNQFPHLDKPVGRWQFSLNPFTLLVAPADQTSLVGRDMRRKVCCWLCCAVFVVLVALIVPFFFMDFVSLTFITILQLE